MKKIYLMLFALLTITQMQAQLDTIAGWHFATDSAELAVLADCGLTGNVNNYDIRAEVESTGSELTIYTSNGSSDYAATAVGWDNGANDKFWSVKFKADGYQNFVVYSKQRAGNNQAGPQDWKLQYKMNGGTWADIPNGTVTCASDWSTGVVSALPLPADCNNPGSTSLYVRWIMTSNTSVNGSDVLSDGVAKIDDIIILGEAVPPADGTLITGWTFPDENDVEFNANLGLTGNLGYDIRAEVESTGDYLTVTTTNGASGSGDYAASAEGWENGANDKFWSIKFKAEGYSDFRLYSKMRSGGNKPGPKNWKVQWKMSGGTWADVTDGTFTIANDWNTGVIENLELPADFNDPGTTSLYIRWIMTSNESIDGVDVLTDGVCKIDDIEVRALNTVGVEEVIFSNGINLFPNPSNGNFNIESVRNIEFVRVVDMQGRVVLEEMPASSTVAINLGDCPNGLYMVQMRAENSDAVTVRKVLINK